MPQKVTSLTPLSPPDNADVLYIVRPSAGSSGSRKITLDALLSTLSNCIADKTVRLAGTTSPTLSASNAVAFYFDSGSNSLKVSENNLAFRDVALIGKAQTYTNVTLTNPTISNFTNAVHDHSDNAHGGLLIDRPVGLTDTTTIATNVLLGSFFRVTLGGNRTLGAPSGTGSTTDAQIVTWEIKQDGTGNRTLALATGAGGFVLGADITGTTLSTGINLTDYLTAVYNFATDRWRVIGFLKGYPVS